MPIKVKAHKRKGKTVRSHTRLNGRGDGEPMFSSLNDREAYLVERHRRMKRKMKKMFSV